jgi:hypothetical protein
MFLSFLKIPRIRRRGKTPVCLPGTDRREQKSEKKSQKYFYNRVLPVIRSSDTRYSSQA